MADIASTTTTPMGDHGASSSLEHLAEGQQIVYGGNRVASVSAELAAAFQPGDRIVVDTESGAILHISKAVAALVDDAVAQSCQAFNELALCSDEQISDFFVRFAEYLADDDVFSAIAVANAADVDSARERGRSVTRLILDQPMRHNMIDGLRGWADAPANRSSRIDEWVHPTSDRPEGEWVVTARRAPLGVVGFVFEGRPNVFADAAGVIRTGNTAVFRIGSDALATATAIMDDAVRPAMAAAGLPDAALGLLNSKEHAAGWALFSHSRLGLAVARGSGPAVAQLGSVAKQSGIAVSLHGTGGAWMLVDASVANALPSQTIADMVSGSLDRKVCNTLNTVCVVAGVDGEVDDDVVRAVVAGIDDAAHQRGVTPRLHITNAARPVLERVLGSRLADEVEVVRASGGQAEPFATEIAVDALDTEWEWEESPEVSIHVVTDADEGVGLFNQYSPLFVLSALTRDVDAANRAYELADTPFFGDGMTRWVDGQYALGTPELGLGNWQHGRQLGRGGILSGEGIYTVRYRAATPANLRRSPRVFPSVG